MSREKMFNSLVLLCVAVIHLVSHTVLKKNLHKHEKIINNLYYVAKTERMILEDNINENLERISNTMQVNFDKNLDRIRAEIEFNKEIVDALHEILEEDNI